MLSGLCYVTAFRIAFPLFNLDNISIGRRQFIARYLLATAIFVGALLSKSVTCSLPAACLLIVYWQRGRITGRDIALMLPWFALGLGAALGTAWLERTHVGASGSAFSWTLVERCWIAGNAVWFYLGKLFWPNPLIFFYPRWSIDIHEGTSWIAPIAAVLIPVSFWLARGRIGRGPLVAVLFFGGTLLPALGFFNVYPMRYSFVADHFQYLASLGPITLIIGGAAATIANWPQRTWWSSLGSIGLILPLCITTWQQQGIYRNVETLWTDVLAKNPTSFAAISTWEKSVRRKVAIRKQPHISASRSDYRPTTWNLTLCWYCSATAWRDKVSLTKPGPV